MNFHELPWMWEDELQSLLRPSTGMNLTVWGMQRHAKIMMIMQEDKEANSSSSSDSWGSDGARPKPEAAFSPACSRRFRRLSPEDSLSLWSELCRGFTGFTGSGAFGAFSETFSASGDDFSWILAGDLLLEGMARLPVLPPCTSSSRASAAHGPCLSRLGLSLDSPSFPLRSCFASCLASRFASCFACFPFLSFFASFSFCFSFCTPPFTISAAPPCKRLRSASTESSTSFQKKHSDVLSCYIRVLALNMSANIISIIYNHIYIYTNIFYNQLYM